MKTGQFLGLALCCTALCCPAQQQADAPPSQKPSSLLRPALESVGRAGSAVDLNHWKGSNAVRDEVDSNLASMQKDLETTLPPLLTAADASPDSAAASLPVLLNLDALYSVLLRITIASRSGAPRDESTALEQSARLLDSARIDLGTAILAAAKAQEKQNAELQAAVQQRTATPAPVVQPAASATTAAKPRKKKAAAKPTTGSQ